MDYSLSKLAETLDIDISVLENYEEEWSAVKDHSINYDETFKEFLCRTFADAAFLTEAIENKGTAVECLEVYDEVYSSMEMILEDL
jgi:hypothetical protein